MWAYAGPGYSRCSIVCPAWHSRALLVVIQVVAGSLRYRHVDDNAYMALMAILLPVLWGFPVIGLIRDSWRKIVFVLMLFMNLSGTVTVMGNAVDRHLFPGGGI